MSKKKIIITLASVIVLSFLILIGMGIYFIYDYGKKNGLLEEDKIPISKEEYSERKSELENQKYTLEQEKIDLEKKYVNKEITYEEYKIAKRELELKENKLEKEFGVDD